MKIKYLTVEDILLLHNLAIEQNGGSHGLRSLEAVEAAVNRPKVSFAGQDLYSDIFEKTASLLHSLILNHPFIDGNKRTGILAAMTILELNHYLFTAKTKEVEDFTIIVAQGDIPVEEITAWLKKHSRKMHN